MNIHEEDEVINPTRAAFDRVSLNFHDDQSASAI
jgi:hypothetical protein